MHPLYNGNKNRVTPHAGNDISIIKLDLFFSLLMCKVNLSNLKHVITPASSESCLFIGPQMNRIGCRIKK